jgi:hypothetical protein
LLVLLSSRDDILFVSQDPCSQVLLSPVNDQWVGDIGLIPLLPGHIDVEEGCEVASEALIEAELVQEGV